MTESPEPEPIRVGSFTMPDDWETYSTVLDLGQDRQVILSREQAIEHACVVLRATSEAEYDSLVLRQQLALGVDRNTALSIMMGTRDRREPAFVSQGLSILPGVSAFTYEPFLTIRVEGVAHGQWSIADARSHALGVLTAADVSLLDTIYRRVLIEVVGLSSAEAFQVVHRLRDEREAVDE